MFDSDSDCSSCRSYSPTRVPRHRERERGRDRMPRERREMERRPRYYSRSPVRHRDSRRTAPTSHSNRFASNPSRNGKVIVFLGDQAHRDQLVQENCVMYNPQRHVMSAAKYLMGTPIQERQPLSPLERDELRGMTDRLFKAMPAMFRAVRQSSEAYHFWRFTQWYKGLHVPRMIVVEGLMNEPESIDSFLKNGAVLLDASVYNAPHFSMRAFLDNVTSVFKNTIV